MNGAHVGLVLAAAALVGVGTGVITLGGVRGATPPSSTQRAPMRSPDARLTFVERDGKERAYAKRELVAAFPLEEIAGFDPYYQRDKRFTAVALAPLLAQALPGAEAGELVLTAEDGYTVPLDGARLLDGTAYLALADAEHPERWDPIGPRRADPGAFYLIWKGADRTDLERFPRPWALVRIARARFEDVYPHTVPATTSAPALHGFAIYRRECVRCHAMNREGGRVGPELNVPQSIVEYRPAAQIRAYVRDPTAFRYGAMPAHPHLGEHDLDDLIAYFTVMKSQKHDPEARK